MLLELLLIPAGATHDCVGVRVRDTGSREQDSEHFSGSVSAVPTPQMGSPSIPAGASRKELTWSTAPGVGRVSGGTWSGSRAQELS